MADVDDRAALRELSERYATAADRRDPEGFVAVFEPGATLEVHNPSTSRHATGELRGHATLATVPERLGRYERTFHLLGNATYSIDGDTAQGEVYCIAHHVLADPDGRKVYVMYIRYDDRYRRDTAAGWRIATRRVLVDFTETRAVDEQ